ncbi:MAG: macro domain-containing protein [Chloroflexi bacterium]|nr:macro domain-containing protein [Chloroflexota bacterium]
MPEVLAETRLPNGPILRAVQGDLTEEAVDAVVNAANSSLAHGGGVAGANVRRGGPEIQAESRSWVESHGSVPTGSAAITGAGRLPARYVIHAVGPVWGSGGEEAKLTDAVQSALALADAHRLQSVSLPGISSGIFGFPKPLAAQVIVGAVRRYCQAHPESSLREVRFCNLDRKTATLFAQQVLEQAQGR